MAYSNDVDGPVVPSRSVAGWAIAVIVILAGVALGLGSYGLTQHRKLERLQESSSRTIEAHLQLIALRNAQVDALDDLAARIDQFNHDYDGQTGKIQVDNLEVSIGAAKKQHLPDEAKKTLELFEQNAKDIAAMTQKMKVFEHYLSAPMTVQKGQSHAQVAKEYLTAEAKLTPEQADDVVRHTALDFDVETGNEVFNLYHDGILLTTVTQGTAKLPPMLVQMAHRRATRNRARRLEDQVDDLTAQVKQLEGKLAAQAAAPVAPKPVAPVPGQPAAKPPPPVIVRSVGEVPPESAKVPPGTFSIQQSGSR